MKRIALMLGLLAVASVSRAAEQDHSGHHRPEPSSRAQDASHEQHQQDAGHEQHQQEAGHEQHQQDAAHEQHQQSAPQSGHEGHEGHEGHVEGGQQEHARDHEHGEHQHAPSDVPTGSERRHVPPDPPSHVMHDMSNAEMIELMGMDDTAAFGMVLADQFEWRDTQDGSALAWDAQAWYGNDYNKLWIESEGEHTSGETEARSELLWNRVLARWWNAQAGIRHDVGEGPSRSWAAFGVQGLAPYWFEVDAMLYVGEQGRTAARFSGEYELLLTQRLVLQPELEVDVYGKSDVENGIGSGIAHSELALRLRYEIRREFAPYVGLVWVRMYGETADLARQAGHDAGDVQFVAGVRAWF